MIAGQEMERVWGESAGIGRRLWNDVETQCSRNFLESSRVTLERTPSNSEYGI